MLLLAIIIVLTRTLHVVSFKRVVFRGPVIKNNFEQPNTNTSNGVGSTTKSGGNLGIGTELTAAIQMMNSMTFSTDSTPRIFIPGLLIPILSTDSNIRLRFTEPK